MFARRGPGLVGMAARTAVVAGTATAEAERLDAEAEGSAATVRRNIQRASNYVLGVVLFSVALFFAGMSVKLDAPGMRKVALAIGCVIFVGTVAWIATFPISLSV